MIWRWLVLILAITLLSLGLLRAEERTYKRDVPISPNKADSTSTNSDKMYEDIEIFRRILDRKLHPLYPAFFPAVTGTMMGMQGMGLVGGAGGLGGIGGIAGLGGGGFNQLGAQGGFQGNFQGGGIGGIAGLGGGAGNFQGGSFNAIGITRWNQIVAATLEGIYLKGQGVVYTATLTSLQAPSQAAKAETTKPVSEWESVRRQLRNEKEEPKKPEKSKAPRLSDTLLKVLAENGHHFSQLGENESLIIVLTVRETSQSALAQKLTQKPAKKASPEPTGKSAESATVRDLELLGDLHLKQGSYDEAITAFRKALESRRESLAKAGLSSLDDPDPKLVVTVYRKLAQCYLLNGQDEKARAVLEEAIVILKRADDTKNKPAPAAKPAMASLPVKLILSAPKNLLDQVKEGKITFDEFRGKARVEKLRFDGNPAHK